MKLKKLQIDRAVANNFKPVSNRVANVEYKKKKKKAEGRMVRADRQQVMDMLFKHQYYNIKDLVEVAKQPVTYLKEILREIGMYNAKGTHKSTWELKPEYRHYQGREEMKSD